MAVTADTLPRPTKPSVVVHFALKLVISLVFAFAAIGKLLDLPGFERSIAAVDWIPSGLILSIAIALVLVELAAVFLVWPQHTMRAGSGVAGTLSCGFALYTAQRIILGASSDCACFGIFLKLNPWLMLLIDSALFAASFAIFRSARFGVTRVPAAERPHPTANLRLPFLLGTLLLCLWFFFRVLPNDPLLRMRIGSLLDLGRTTSAYSPITPAMLKSDPPMLTKLPVPSVQSFDSRKPTFMVFATGCSLCSLGGMMAADQVGRGEGDNVIVVSPSPIADMRKFVSDHQLRVFVVSDPGNRYYKPYNLSFRTRVYLLDKSRRLVWKQEEVRADPDEMRKVARTLER